MILYQIDPKEKDYKYTIFDNLFDFGIISITYNTPLIVNLYP